jgi:hypothetical protein
MRRAVFLIGFTVLITSVGSHGPRTSCQGAETDPYTFRKEAAQTVLYRVHRGARATIGAAVIELYGLAAKEKIKTNGPFTLVALNNPLAFEADHVLTEIRIPVDHGTVANPGKLGPMTGVKPVAAHEVAVTVKRYKRTPEERNSVAVDLYKWIPFRERGQIGVFGWRETYFGDYRAEDYDQVPVEISVAIVGRPSLPQGK